MVEGLVLGQPSAMMRQQLACEPPFWHPNRVRCTRTGHSPTSLVPAYGQIPDSPDTPGFPLLA